MNARFRNWRRTQAHNGLANSIHGRYQKRILSSFMNRPISYFLLLAFLWIQTAAASDWPLFRGNPQLTGVSTNAQLPEKLETVWTFEAGTGIESSPTISQGIVYIGSLDGNLYAVDLDSGKLKWKFQATDEIKSSPSISADSVYFGDEKGSFFALDKQTGQKRWDFKADAGVTSSANFSGDRVII